MSERQLRDLDQERALRNKSAGLWRTLGFELRAWEHGRAVISWPATPDYGFVTATGVVIQGGLVTALLDAAMGSACWTVLDTEQIFLTADLRVEFLRSAPPTLLTATATVVRATRRVVFCSAELHDSTGLLLAAGRCTQVVLPAEHRAGRGIRTATETSGPEAQPLG